MNKTTIKHTISIIVSLARAFNRKAIKSATFEDRFRYRRMVWAFMRSADEVAAQCLKRPNKPHRVRRR